MEQKEEIKDTDRRSKKLLYWLQKNIEERLECNTILNEFLKWFNSDKKLAFLITLFVGIITHITMITDTIMSQDGLWNSMEYSRPGVFEMTLGRWGIEIMQRFNYFIAIPTVSTVSCIIVMAITAVFLVDLFELKSKFSIIFTASILAVIPTFTVTLLYIYTAFAYCSNMLIATLVIWFIYKAKHKKMRMIISVFLLTLSLSIYQSYVGVSIGLCVIMTIIDLIRNEKSIKEVFTNVGKSIVVVIAGGLLYYGITTILLSVNKLSLSDYKDINSFSIKEILLGLGTTIPNCYKDFFNFFLTDTIVLNKNYRRQIFYAILFGILGISVLISAIAIKSNSKKEKWIRAGLSVILVLFLPIALNFIDILVKNNVMYALTATQMVLMIPMGTAIIEEVNGWNLMKWVAIFSCLYIVGTYYIADNASYADMKMRFNQAQAVSIRIMNRIETTPGYQKEYPICIVGIIGDNNYPKVGNLHEFSVGSVFENPVFHGSYDGAVGTMYQYLRIFLGEDVHFCDGDTYEKIVKSEEFQKLNDFPEENCTAIIDGVIVMKLSNYIPLPNGTLLYEEY